MIGGYRPAGAFWCPTCLARGPFYTPPGHEGSEHPPLECSTCGYTYGIVEVEHLDGRIEKKHALPVDVRRKALDELRESFRGLMLSGGVRRNVLDRRIEDTAKKVGGAS